MMIRFFSIILCSLLAVALSASLISYAETSSEKSSRLTGQALKEIDAHNFRNAYVLIMEAVKLDPSNETAKKLFVNLNELIIQEGYIPRKDVSKQIIADRDNTVKKSKTAMSDAKSAKSIPVLISAGGFSFIEAALMYTTGESDYLGYVNSDVKLFGVRVEAGHYLELTGGRLGFSGEYTGNLFKLAGDNRIDFTQHRLYAFLLNRNEYFKNDSGALVFGFRAGYHYYSLYNKKKKGAYYYTRLNGPAFGIFFSDPLFYRIWKNDNVKFFGIEGGITSVPVYWMSDPVLALEYNAGLTYDYKSLRFSLRWRSYWINNGDVNETFNNIEIGTYLRM